MKFKDYYATFDLPRSATQDEIKRAYRKLARKYHPDVSKTADTETRFKELGEAYAVLKDPEKRAAYDQMGNQWQAGQDFQPPPGFEFGGRGFDPGAGDDLDQNDFFEALFGRQAKGARQAGMHARGEDHHAKILIDLQDAYRGAQRGISLRMPSHDAQGQLALRERRLDISIPKGIRAGQHLRLTGQGQPGHGDGPAGDLFLEIGFNPQTQFRIDGRDVYTDLPLAPWEAALGCALPLPTPGRGTATDGASGLGSGAPITTQRQRYSWRPARRSLCRADHRAAAGRQRRREGGLPRHGGCFRFQSPYAKGELTCAIPTRK